MTDIFDAAMTVVFGGAGAVELSWERAEVCTCLTADTRQPQWGHPACQGLGVLYTAPTTIRAVFRDQSRWPQWFSAGEVDHAQGMLSTPVDVMPNYVDHRVRDRFKVLVAAQDDWLGRVFVPTSEPTPFIIGGVQRAWRVTVKGFEESQLALANP